MRARTNSFVTRFVAGSIIGPIAGVGICAAAWAASGASAGLVYINSDQVEIGGIQDAVMGAKYRMSNSNFDQSLDNGNGTSAGQFIQASWGNNSFLNNRSFAFTVSHLANEGFIFTMSDGATSKTLSWGDFAVTPSGTTSSLLGGQNAHSAFNAIFIEARAERDGSAMNFSNLLFTSADLSIADGDFFGGTAALPNGAITQKLVSTVDLSTVNWSISGTVSGVRDTTSSGDELVRFTIGGKVVEYTIVPAPGAAALIALAGVFGSRRRRM